MTNKEMARKQTKPKRQRKPPACPECGSSEVVPIIHGVITPSLQKSIDEGKAIRADREEWEGMTEWYCKQCGCDWSSQWKRFKKPANFPPVR
jgi:transcription elongation factor Elf1